MTADRAARTVALLILMAAASAMCIEIAWLADALRTDLMPQAEAVVAKADVTLNHSNIALSSWQEQAVGELRETRKATADLHDLLIHTDISLNGRHGDGGVLGELHADTLPRIYNLLDSSDGAVLDLDRTLNRIGDSTDTVVSQTGTLVVALTARVNDPQYDSILANAAASMANLKDTTSQGLIVATDVRKVADEWAAPVKGLWNHVKVFLFEAAGPLAEVVSAFK